MLACSAFADLQTDSIAPAVQPMGARDFYNVGTELLAAKKFADAEQMFVSALAVQDERVRPIGPLQSRPRAICRRPGGVKEGTNRASHGRSRQ